MRGWLPRERTAIPSQSLMFTGKPFDPGGMSAAALRWMQRMPGG
jgi:hypothetical protein